MENKHDSSSVALKIKNIPPMPQIAEKVLMMKDDEVDFYQLEKLIILDQGLSSKILQVANSAFYARPKEITSIKSALTLLGFRTVKSLALMIVNSSLWKKIKAKEISDLLHKHSIHTAFFVREIARFFGYPIEVVDELFMIGLMHDVGKTLLIINFPKEYKEAYKLVEKGSHSYKAAEKEVMGIDHTEVGEFVAKKWNLSGKFVSVIKEHHNIDYDGEYKRENLMIALANHLSKQIGYGELTPEMQDEIQKLREKLNINDEDMENIEQRMYKTMQKDPYYLTIMEVFKQVF